MTGKISTGKHGATTWVTEKKRQIARDAGVLRKTYVIEGKYGRYWIDLTPVYGERTAKEMLETLRTTYPFRKWRAVDYKGKEVVF